MPHGTSVGRPHSSPLMKLATRPNNSPSGTVAAHRSMVLSVETLFQRENSQIARPQPSSAPWKAMPPFQTIAISDGFDR